MPRPGRHALQAEGPGADDPAVSGIAQGTPRSSTALRVLAAATLVLLVVFDVVTAVSPRTEPSDLWDTWVYGLVMTGAAAVPLVRAATVRAESALWATLGVAIALYAVGDWLYVLWVQTLVPEPYPSASDALSVAFYLVAAVAVVRLVRAELPVVPVGVWLDGLVAGLGATTLASALSFDTIARAGASGSPLETTVNLAYPLADLVLLGVAAAAVAVQRWRVGARWVLLGAGLLCFGGGDTVYVWTAATGGYTAGGLLDASWPTGAVLMSLAALTPAPRRLTARREDAVVLVVPLAVAAAALALLVAQERLGVSGLSLVLAALTVAAALARVATTVREVTALADARDQAGTDELTGLANRRRYFEVLERATRRGRARVAVAMLDLDRFKAVNDSLGHDVGDALLRTVADRLRHAVGGRGLVARLGGDEFAMVLPADDAAPAVEELVRGAVRALGESTDVGGLHLRTSASAGLAFSTGAAHEVDALMRNADAALYRAKRAGGGVEVAGAGDEEGAALALRLAEDLREGLADGSVLVHVQPQVEARDGRVSGVEALARWDHPREGLLEPASFLDVVAQAGAMPRLTARVLDAALTARASWAAGGGDLRVGVNLSPADLLDEGLVGVVADAVRRHAVPPGALELEVDARSVGDVVGAARLLGDLRSLGVRVALDRFDPVTSPLGLLRALPLDTVKLSGPDLAATLAEERGREVVRSVVATASALGVRVVVVGVEDDVTARRCAALRCDGLQGYALAAPLPPEVLGVWLARWRDARSRHDAPPAVGVPVGARARASVS